jgi:hypothetical protein
MAKKQTPARGPGRPPIDADEDTIPVTVRMTLPQREKLKRLGGAGWVRSKIDSAREPEPKG